MSDLIFLTPVFHEKIWGGRKLETVYGYDIPKGAIGECWAISAHPHGDCVVAEGEYAGKHLSELWDEHRELFGNLEGDRFPLLIKIIDAAGDLSIQVHPDDEYARVHEDGSLGKRECWYVLDADPGTTIVIGQKAHDKAEFARMVAEGRWSELLNEVPCHTGDFFQIDPGTIHAIKGGTLILESQQSSDVTYRVYDYDRVQADGTKRPLHVQQSEDVVDYSMVAPESGRITNPEVDGITNLVTCKNYAVDRVRVDGAKTLPAPATFLDVSVIEGSGSVCGHELHKGTHLVVPAGVAPAFEGTMTLITSRP
jgi:mannose-6-phosphate isomerase